MTSRLAELTPDNAAAACRISVRPEQQKFVATVVESIAEAYVHYGTAWPRLGYGRFAVEAIAAEARRRGCQRITVS